MSNNQLPPIDVICDLRRFSVDVNDIGTLQVIWQQVNEKLVGQSLIQGQPIAVHLPQGEVSLWVVDAHNVIQVGSDTAFKIIDVLRSPQLVYRCRDCGKYGPLRCNQCKDQGRPERLCSKCARMIKDELSAYCSEHIPKCNCQPKCTEDSTFRCRRCRKLFGEHVIRQNPHDLDTDYCLFCYRILFERCSVCESLGDFRLGKSKCAYHTREMENACSKPLCWAHSYQWKIWGPHNRGVTLCERHKQILGSTDPADLLFMMLTARPPYIRRGKRQSLPNPFRLRRIINRNRTTPLTFDQLNYVSKSLERRVSDWGRHAENNYRYMMKSFNEIVGGLPSAEANLLTQVRAFYQQTVGSDAAQQITGVEIIDRFSKPGQSSRYRVYLHLNTANKGIFIGRGGATINLLCSRLNIEVDM